MFTVTVAVFSLRWVAECAVASLGFDIRVGGGIEQSFFCQYGSFKFNKAVKITHCLWICFAWALGRAYV